MNQFVEKLLIEPAPARTGVHALFEFTPVATLLLAPNGAIVRANAAAHAQLACAPNALPGKSAAQFLPELWHGTARSSEDVNEADAPRRLTVRREDGTSFVARVRFAHLDQGQFLATLEDLTESDRQLADAQAQVVAANREFQKFIDVAAHDLRAPLRILTDFTNALDDECGARLEGEGAGFLKEIRNASARMEGIIDGLLGLARAGRAEMGCESLDLTTLVELVFYELRHAESGREVECAVEPGLVGWGDVRLMMTVLRALIGNAWKFTGRVAAPAIRVHSEKRDGRTWFCVTDNGAGFDMTHAARLFKPFTRLHRQDEFAGHGLGLATVHCIVKRHGGEIEASAQPGQGASLRFTLAAMPE
jgi:signal transduction histidine kinase